MEPPSDVVPSPYCTMPTILTGLMPSCVASVTAWPTFALDFVAISFAIAISPVAVGSRPSIGEYGLSSSDTLENTKLGAPPV